MGIRALIFDFGGTLIDESAGYAGPCVEWPRIDLLPGVAETLPKLAVHYRLYVGSNAQASNGEMVMAALDRAGIGHLISRSFTPKELAGEKKPAKEYFSRIIDSIGADANEVMMVGDLYKTDILGAFNAGIKSVWLNPAHAAAPALLPFCSASVDSIDALPKVLESPLSPDLREVYGLYGTQKNSVYLRIHVELVAACAYALALMLQRNGCQVDAVLAHRGGLVHDIGKITAAEEGGHHDVTGERILLDKGCPALARIARSHMLSNILDAEHAPKTLEEKIVYLADKLIDNGQLVSVSERLSGLKRRYNTPDDRMDQVAVAIDALVTELCKTAGFGRDELLPKLRQMFDAVG